MSLDLGALVAHAGIEDVQFQRSYVRLVRQFADLGGKATATAAGTDKLDASLGRTAATGNAAATGLGRANKAMAEAGLSASEAAVTTQALQASTTEAGLAASKLTQAELRLSVAQERVNALMAGGGSSATKLAGAQATLMGATDRAALAQERLGKATGVTSQAWQSTGRRLLVTGGLIAAGFALAGHQAAEFDAEMANLRSLARHASDSELRDLRDAALSAGQAYGFTADEVAEAETELVKAGVSVTDILGGALSGALTLAAAGQEDVAEATATAAVAMTQFRMSGKDVPAIADMLSAGADKALGSVHDLSEALRYGGLAASDADWSLEQTVGTLAELAQAGQIGSVAGAGLAMMLTNLQKPTDKAAALLKQYNIQLYDSEGQFVSTSDLAGQLHDKLSMLPPAERDAALATIFTSRARRIANILTRDGAAANLEWIASVDDTGFAALQAAGKLDSLTGDVTKMKAAFQEAFITTGEGAQGPLREVVQAITAVVQAWNDLPAPVRLVSEAVLGTVGALALAGGATVIFIAKWRAMNTVLAETRIGAIGAGTALKGLGKAAGAVAILIGVVEAAKAIRDALAPLPPDVDLLTDSIVRLGKEGIVAGELASVFGAGLGELEDEADRILNEGTLDKINEKMDVLGITHAGEGIREARRDFESLDEALAGLVENGSADQAADAFGRIEKRLRAAGFTTEQVASLLPDYAHALAASASSAEAAGDGVDKYGNAVSDAAKETRDATDAAKDYSDRLHAMADPLFAMNSALADLRDKQHAVTKAMEEHGRKSRAVRQAQIDLASSALDVTTAATDLAAAVQSGDVKLGQARRTLRDWAADGLITKRQADDIITSFGGLIDKADTLSRLHPKVRVTADISQAVGAFDKVRWYLNQIHDKTIDVTVRELREAQGPSGVLRRAAGGPVPGVGTTDSVRALLTPREFVVRQDGSNLDDAYRYYGRTKPNGLDSPQIVIYNPEPERASVSIPRALAEAQYVYGPGWSS